MLANALARPPKLALRGTPLSGEAGEGRGELTVHGYKSGVAAKAKAALKTLAFATSLPTLCLSSSAPAGEDALFLSDQRTPRPHRFWQPAWERLFCLFVCKQSGESKPNTVGRTAHRKPEHVALRWTRSVAFFFFFCPSHPDVGNVGYQLQARRCRVFKCKLHVWKSCTQTSGSE